MSTCLANGSVRLIRIFSTVAGALKSKTPSFVDPIASRIAKKTENYFIQLVAEPIFHEP